MNDGVIKYTINHTIFDSRIPYDIYSKLEDVRNRLYHLGLIGVSPEKIGYGNLSLKERGENRTFYITATQTGHLTQLGTSLYTQVNSYDFKTFTLYSKGKNKPSSEALSHAMIYELDPTICAVIHIHSKALWNFMRENNYLFTNAPYGTQNMTKEIANLYPDRSPLNEPMFVMKGHEDGIIIFGKTLQKAENKLFDLLREYLDSNRAVNLV